MIYTCIFCKKEIKDRPSTKRKYCSNKCQGLYRQELAINSGKATEHTFRHYLLRIFGNKCAICKLDKWLGQPIPVVLDHIDGNSTNNLLNNLRLICNNCDSLTPIYKGRNKGKGRYSRRVRYQQGRSY